MFRCRFFDGVFQGGHGLIEVSRLRIQKAFALPGAGQLIECRQIDRAQGLDLAVDAIDLSLQATQAHVTGFNRELKRLKVGPGIDPDTQIGPLVSATQLDRVLGYLDIGKREGARLTDGIYARDFFGPPTVFTDESDSMRIAGEEIFGPVLSAFCLQGRG